MGIAGSATATLLSNGLAMAFLLRHLYRKQSVLALRRSELKYLVPHVGYIKTLLLKGLPMGAQMLVTAVAAILMMSIVNQFGLTTAAAYSASIQLWNYVLMPAVALAAAVSAMAAQNVGAGHMERVERLARVAVVYSMFYTAIPIAIILIGDTFILRAFLPEGSPSLAIAVHLNAITLWCFILSDMTFVLSGVVRATGAVWPPLLAMICGLSLVRIPFAKYMTATFGADAVWMSFPAGDLVTLSIMLAYYRWGRWRSAKLVGEKIRLENNNSNTALNSTSRG